MYLKYKVLKYALDESNASQWLVFESTFDCRPYTLFRRISFGKEILF